MTDESIDAAKIVNELKTKRIKVRCLQAELESLEQEIRELDAKLQVLAGVKPNDSFNIKAV